MGRVHEAGQVVDLGALGGNGASVEEGLAAVGRGVVAEATEVLEVEDDVLAVALQVWIVGIEPVGDDADLDAGAVDQVVGRWLGLAGLELHVHHLQGLWLQERHRRIGRADLLQAVGGRDTGGGRLGGAPGPAVFLGTKLRCRSGTTAWTSGLAARLSASACEMVAATAFTMWKLLTSRVLSWESSLLTAAWSASTA